MEEFETVNVISSSDIRTLVLAKKKEKGELFLINQFSLSDTMMKNANKFVDDVKKYSKISYSCFLPVKGYIAPSVENNLPGSVIYGVSQNGNLSSIIQKVKIHSNSSILDPTQIMVLITGIILSMKMLHSLDIIHGDLSPSTVFLDSNFTPILSSYGFPYLFSQRKLSMGDAGNQMQLPPEMFDKSPPPLSKKSDIYAFAMLMFRILSKKIVFKKGANCISFSQNIIEGLRPIIPQWIPPFLREIIDRCWDQNPNDRPSFVEIESLMMNGITVFCKGINRSIFDKYVSEVSKDKSKKDGKAKHDAPKSSSTSSLNSLSLDPEYSKHAKEIKEIKNLKALSKKGKERAIQIILLQELLMKLETGRIESTVGLILGSIDFNDPNEVICLASNIALAASFRFQVTCVYATFVLELINNATPENNILFLKPMLLRHLFEGMLKGEPLPSLSAEVSFIHSCFIQGVFSGEEIVREIRYFFYNRSRCKRSVFLVFCWFSPQIEDLDVDMYEEILGLLLEYSKDEFCPKAFKHFAESINDLSINEWEKHKSLFDQSSVSTIEGYLRKDDLSSFQKRIVSQEINVNKRYTSNVYEPCPFAHDRPNYAMISAIYNASKIFQYIQMIGSTFYLKDQKGRTLPVFAVAGGNSSIIRLVDQLQCDFDASLQTAASFHQNEVFKNLVRGKEQDLNESDRFGKLVITSASASNNVFVLLYCLMQGINAESRETFGWTPLHTAAEKGRTEAIEVLFEINGINVNITDIWIFCVFLELLLCILQQIDAKLMLLNSFCLEMM